MIGIMSDLSDALQNLGGSTFRAEAGSFMFKRQDAIQSLYLVMEGSAHLVRHTRDGACVVLQRANAGTVLAEASIFSDHYHCDGVALTSLVAMSIRIGRVRRALAVDPELSNLLGAHLAREVQRQRTRAEILALKTVSARLSAWLEFNGNVLPMRGQWRAVAEDIGVSPEAFYRELALRR